MRFTLAAVSAAALLAACSGQEEAASDEAETSADGAMTEDAMGAETMGEETMDEAAMDGAAEAAPETGSLAWAVAGDWRGDQAARDEFRNPQETLEFFGVDPSGVVVEIWPGGGWYANILAPWIAANGGTYVAAHFPSDGSERMDAFLADFEERFSDPRYGEIAMAEFGAETGPIVEPGTADAILTFRNTHSWMGRGFAEKAFADFHEALKPGGVLGLVQHRLPGDREQDPRAATGYVQQDYVVTLAEEAGFELVSSSEINANPADDADHPFGVWTLPPTARTSDFGEEPNPDFDQSEYLEIGESDRMTLLFRKPE